MIILSWNCRRLGNLRTVQELDQLVKEKRPNLVFLMETKLCKGKMERIRIKLKFRNMFVMDNIGKSNGLALFWEDECKAEIQNYSQRHINAIINNHHGHMEWKFTGFYGHPDASKRGKVWNLLKALALLNPEPWMCIRDFNEVLMESKKIRGNTHRHNLIQAFR